MHMYSTQVSRSCHERNYAKKQGILIPLVLSIKKNVTFYHNVVKKVSTKKMMKIHTQKYSIVE